MLPQTNTTCQYIRHFRILTPLSLDFNWTIFFLVIHLWKKSKMKKKNIYIYIYILREANFNKMS